MVGGSTSPTRSTPPGTHSFTLRAFAAGRRRSIPTQLAGCASIRISLLTLARCARTRSGCRAGMRRRTRSANLVKNKEQRTENKVRAICSLFSILCSIQEVVMNELWPWLTLALLGAYHGINPAMGWLFAVALGLQERSRTAVLRALAPIALGHAAATTLAVAIVGLAQALVPLDVLRLVCASTLIGFGVYKLIRRAHPRWVGMRVGFRDLTAW